MFIIFVFLKLMSLFCPCNPSVATPQEFGIPLSLLRVLEPLIKIEEDKEADVDSVITQVENWI